MHRRFAVYAATLSALLAAPLALADKVVWFDFTNSGLADDVQQEIVRRAHAKFEFTVDGFNVGDNLRFVRENPGGAPNRVIFDNRLVASDYGVTRGNESTVFRRKLTHGHFRNFFDTAARQTNSMVDTAAHELAHQKLPGDGHNAHAPNTRDEVVDARGDRYVRTPGDGTLVGGRPGLMAGGRHVIPAEHAANERQFTADERTAIARTLRREKEGRATRPAPNPEGRQTDLCFVKGRRFDPESDTPSPDWPSPFPLDEMDDTIDMSVELSGNALWDFGFATADDGFMPLVRAGESLGDLGFDPGTAVNFAIRQLGAPDDSPGLTLANIGEITLLSEAVSPGDSVEPTMTAPYFRRAQLTFDPDLSPATPNVLVTLRFATESPQFYDGVYPIPEPAALALVCLAAVLMRSRRG